jgi:GTP1/Obg family GTP-binding protein
MQAAEVQSALKTEHRIGHDWLELIKSKDRDATNELVLESFGRTNSIAKFHKRAHASAHAHAHA